jgi:hypothetical protein
MHDDDKTLRPAFLSSTRIPHTLPAAEIAYLEAIIDRVHTTFGSRLVGAYLFGSAGSGEYEPGISDLDVQIVISETVSIRQRNELAWRLAHAVLPCPAQRLDFVCDTRSALEPANRQPHFEFNFNTSSIFEQLMLEARAEAPHWFLLDIALGRELGHALLGPSPAAMYAPIPRMWLLQAMSEALAWRRMRERASPSNVLNACREWRYAATGVLGSKAAGAAWARSQPDCPPVVTQAELARRAGTLLDPEESSALIAIIDEAVRQAVREVH